MTAPKHTPGPWRIGGLQVFAGEAPDARSVCMLPALFDSEANARLIAAAPEMREALQETIDGGMAVKQQIEREERIRALLARIDGEDL